jgi:diguanylate cyclase (GGDEF)-like protein
VAERQEGHYRPGKAEDCRAGMEMKIPQKLLSSLHFRILAPLIPIIALMAILGGAIFSLGLGTVSHYANARIEEDLDRASREIYNICDIALQNLLLDGLADDRLANTIRKGNTLGKIEEYARQHDLEILVYEGERKEVLLHQASMLAGHLMQELEAARDGGVVPIAHADNEYYARESEFELWGWHIVLIKDGRTYAEFVDRISRSYYAIGVVLLLVSVMLILYFRRVVHAPVRSIIASIQSNGMPEYKGIYEFEFLSDVIREATRKAQQKQVEMSYQASHDELTALANRREFERRLKLLLQTSQEPHAIHTILYLDLDQFKIINDTCGHHAGDALLQQLTVIMKEQLRQNDLLARLGGDEFGVLFENCAGEPALQIAEALRQIVSEFRFAWTDKLFSIGVSIGMVSFAKDELALNDILSIVDGACYIAKDKGRNRIHVYHPNDSELMERKGQMNWVSRISDAIKDERMVLYRQEIIPLQHSPDKTVHFEILLRMLDEDGHLVLPSSFLPAAERYNLMPMIDFWVVKTAFEYCRDACTDPDMSYTCAINLSGGTLCDERLVSYIQTQLQIFGIAPSMICFEITETIAIANLNSAVSLIRELRQMGCRFALDDFGSGMSSFGYLKNLPVDFIKIDGSFVRNMLNDRTDRAMVKAINNIGQEMGIRTIAEFVEDDQTREALRKIKVDFAQGFGIGKPRPLVSDADTSIATIAAIHTA